VKLGPPPSWTCSLLKSTGGLAPSRLTAKLCRKSWKRAGGSARAASPGGSTFTLTLDVYGDYINEDIPNLRAWRDLLQWRPTLFP
jgi:hypothetical protein